MGLTRCNYKGDSAISYAHTGETEALSKKQREGNGTTETGRNECNNNSRPEPHNPNMFN